MASTPFPTSVSDLFCDVDFETNSFYKSVRELRRSTLSIPNRLRSILEDAEVVDQVATAYKLPLVANERCGSWYIDPQKKAGSAYFKSTDGHHGQWDFSLRRLNLHLLPLIGEHGGAVVVDSTRRGKVMPDAFSKTVPIWVAVMNRALFPGRTTYHTLQGPPPPNNLGESEIAQITAKLRDFEQAFRALRIDIDVLRAQISNPIRVEWIAHVSPAPATPQYSTSASEFDASEDSDSKASCLLVLCSASRRVQGTEMSAGGYIQGAGDDSEGWSRGLTPQLLWKHKADLMERTAEDDLPNVIRRLLADEMQYHRPRSAILIKPTRNLFLENSGPDFDARLLNVGYTIRCQGTPYPPSPRVLDLNCRTGKLGSRDLRGKLPAARNFVSSILQRDPDSRLTICCLTGRDLSVGVALMLLCQFYRDDGTSTAIRFPGPDTNAHGEGSATLAPPAKPVGKLLIKQRLAWISSAKPDVSPSRATLQSVNSFLMERP